MDAVRSRTADPEDLVREWDDILVSTRSQITLPPIDSAATTVPPAVRDQLNGLLHRLTDADYRSRERRSERIGSFALSMPPQGHWRIAIQSQDDRLSERRGDGAKSTESGDNRSDWTYI